MKARCVDGPVAEAQFDFPYALMLASKSSLLVSDCFNNAIRLVNLNTREVSKFITDIPTPKHMVMHPSGTEFYLCMKNSVVKADVPSRTYNILTSTEPGYQDGHIATSKFEWPSGLDWLAHDTLVVADTSLDKEYNSNTKRIRVISLEEEEVTSMCPSVSLTTDECSFYNVQSVLKSGDQLYIGGDGSINVKNMRIGFCERVQNFCSRVYTKAYGLWVPES